MSAFSDYVRAHGERAGQNLRAIFLITVTEVQRSIQTGSPLTGALGQPVQTGNLRDSYQLVFPLPTLAVIESDLPYALVIESGVGRFGPITIRSSVGGIGSIRATRQNFDRIVEAARKQVVAR